MLTSDDFVYENAPLREVIVQIWWRLQPIFGSADAAIDPHLSVFAEEFKKAAHSEGFTHVERVVPEEIPHELLAHKAILRFRKRPDEWPVLQIGPGVLTANIVPPYRGWKDFAPFAQVALELLWKSYPLPSHYLRITRVHLNYINGFTRKHGLISIPSFTRDHLQLAPPLQPGLLDLTDQKDGAGYSGTVELSTRKPAGALLVLAYSPGKIFDEPALILQNQMITAAMEIPQSPTEIMQWLSEARMNTQRAFEAIVPTEIKMMIGPRTTISC
jgi:uncharacterized protein (TIGR04255 family)